VERQTIEGTAEPTPAPSRFEVAPLDEYAQRITSGFAYLGGLLMLPLLFAYLANLRWEGLLVPTAVALPLACFLLLSWMAQPQLYELTATELVVRRRRWRPLRVPLALIRGAAVASTMADVPQRRLRFAFNVGVFGYQGPFRLAPYGEAFFLATNRTRLVAVARSERTALILSPARPRQFVETLNELRTSQALETLREGDKPGARTEHRAPNA
jgi:hypothetical protein